MKTLKPMRDEQGFTLAELLMAVLLMSILFLSAWGVFSQGFIFWKHGEQKIDMYDSLRMSLNRMGRELRYTQGVTASSNGTDLYFINSGGATIRYYCSSYTLYRQVVGQVAQPLASDISTVGFIYYNSAGTQIYASTQSSLVRQVKITITAARQGSSVSPVVLVQKVSLRALR